MLWACTLIHFQQCIRLYDSALSKREKKACSILSCQKCQPLNRGPQQMIQPGLAKHYTNSRYASAALQHPSAHIQAMDLESSLDQKQNPPLVTLVATLFMYTQHRGGGSHSAGSLRINTTRLVGKRAKSSSSPTHAHMHTHLLQAENQAQCSHVNCVHEIHCKPTTVVEAAAQGLKFNTMHSSHNT